MESHLDIDLGSSTLLVAFHPVTILHETTLEADALFAALRRVDGQIVFVYPNSDAGSHKLIKLTEQFAATRTSTRIFINLDAITYWSLLRFVDVLIGNSSSGIMESASFSLPTVNIGMRQQGRERACNVIDSLANEDAIVEGIEKAISPDFRARRRALAIDEYSDGDDNVSL